MPIKEIVYKEGQSTLSIKNTTLFGAFLLGIGMVGMLEGICFPQLVNGGVAHFGVTLITFWAAIVLWNSNPWSEANRDRRFWSGIVLGAGVFTLFVGIINHQILQIHHVRPGDPHQLTYDLVFDGMGLLMVIVGWLLYRSLKTDRRYIYKKKTISS